MANDAAPLDPRKEEAELRKARAEANKLEAEALSAWIESYSTKIPSTLPTGTLAAPSEPSPLGAVAAYRALESAAAQIAVQIGTDKIGPLWIAPENPLPHAQAAHQQIVDQTHKLTAALDKAGKVLEARPSPPARLFEWSDGEVLAKAVKEERARVDVLKAAVVTPNEGLQVVDREATARAAPMAAAVGLQMAFSALPLIVSLFETKSTIINDSLTIGFRPVAAAVAHRLKEAADGIIVSGVSSSAATDMTAAIQKLASQRDAVQTALSQFRADRAGEPPAVAAEVERLTILKSVIDAVIKSVDKASSVEAVLGIVRETTAEIRCVAQNIAAFRQSRAKDQATADDVDETLKAVDKVLTALTTTAEGINAVQAASHYELFDKAEGGHILVLDVSYAGRRSTFQEKLGPDHELHVGSLVVTWYLLGKDGSVKTSSVTPAGQAATTAVGKADVTWSTTDPVRQRPVQGAQEDRA